jgi:presqualene diphosphate synthase
MNVQVPESLTDRSSPANRAGGSSFYLAMRLLSRKKREAIFEVYSFCREVDDIADNDAPRPQRLALLSEWRQNICALYSGNIPIGLERLAKIIARFELRKEDFLAVIDGVEMDAREDIRAPSLEQLELYCDRVASAVGRLCVRIFGMSDADGKSLAHHLGRALQLTNTRMPEWAAYTCRAKHWRLPISKAAIQTQSRRILTSLSPVTLLSNAPAHILRKQTRS